jgi:hypothetical protein
MTASENKPQEINKTINGRRNYPVCKNCEMNAAFSFWRPGMYALQTLFAAWFFLVVSWLTLRPLRLRPCDFFRPKSPNNQITRRNIARDQPFHSHRYENLKSYWRDQTPSRKNEIDFEVDLSRYSDGLWAGWRANGGSNPARGKRFFSSPFRPDQLWGPPILLSKRYRGLFSRVWSSRGVNLTTRLYLVLRFWMLVALPLLPMTYSWHCA